MSILIKGMEMPTSCEDCPMCHSNAEYDYAYCCVSSAETSGNKIPSDCPLVPVPPHGRLVDMDEIEERIDSCCDDIDCSKTMCNECAVQIVMNKVFDAPTIIPAEIISENKIKIIDTKGKPNYDQKHRFVILEEENNNDR